MIYNGICFDQDTFNITWGTSESSGIKRQLDLESVPGKNGSYVKDAKAYEDVTITYKAWMKIPSEHARELYISRFVDALCTGKKCPLEDPRYTNYFLNAVVTNIHHGAVGVKPTLFEEFEVEFSADPYMYSKAEKRVPLDTLFNTHSTVAIPFKLKATMQSEQAPHLLIRDNLGNAFRLDKPISKGQELSIDTDSGLILQNRMQGQTLFGFDLFFKLEPNKDILISSSHELTGEVIYREVKLIG